MSNRKISIPLAELPPYFYTKEERYSPKQQNDIVIGFFTCKPPFNNETPQMYRLFFFRSYFILPCFLLSERIRRKETRNLHTYNFR